MPTPLEVELKTYAHNLVATYVKEEYDSQIRGKWQPYINRMVDAQTAAIADHQKRLDAVRAQIQREKEASFGLAMLALTLVSGPVLSWVAGKIQYKWFPRLTELPKTRDRALWIAKWNTEQWSRYSVLELDHDKVWAKVFGDLGKEIVVGTAKAIPATTPPKGSAENAIQVAADSNQPSFKSNLENAMLAEADLTIAAILSVSMKINENSNYGAECLTRLREKHPRLKDARVRVTDAELETLAKAMIREDINTLRKRWADEWFYFGHDPGSTAGLAEAIEIELWGLWILNEKLRIVTHHVGSPDNPLVSAKVPVVEGKTFGGGVGVPKRNGDRGVPEGLLVRLAEFGAVEPRTELQKLRAIAEAGVKEQMEKEAALKRELEEKKDRAAQEAIEDLEDSRSSNPELARFNRAMARAAKAKQKPAPVPVAPKKPDPERPAIAVGLSVDTQAEIDALERWAKYHPLKLGSGTMRHVKRTLPSIENILASRVR